MSDQESKANADYRTTMLIIAFLSLIGSFFVPEVRAFLFKAKKEQAENQRLLDLYKTNKIEYHANDRQIITIKRGESRSITKAEIILTFIGNKTFVIEEIQNNFEETHSDV